ncbi:hypothetical protein ACFMJX_06495, partial [Acinetobacter baumannii]
FAPLWIIFEWAKTWVFTGFPWLFVGYAFTERLLDGYAPLFGINALIQRQAFYHLVNYGTLVENDKGETILQLKSGNLHLQLGT